MSLIGLTALHFGSISDTPKAPHLRVSIHREIVCPRCGAAIGSSCSSPTGRRTRPHSERMKGTP